MSILEIVNLMSSKTGDELFQKLTEIFNNMSISVKNENGSIKDLYTISCEVADVLNKSR